MSKPPPSAMVSSLLTDSIALEQGLQPSTVPPEWQRPSCNVWVVKDTKCFFNALFTFLNDTFLSLRWNEIGSVSFFKIICTVLLKVHQHSIVFPVCFFFLCEIKPSERVSLTLERRASILNPPQNSDFDSLTDHYRKKDLKSTFLGTSLLLAWKIHRLWV